MFETAGTDETAVLLQPLDDILVSILQMETKTNNSLTNEKYTSATILVFGDDDFPSERHC